MDDNKLIGGVKVTSVLGLMGLAHQVGYWEEFGVNVLAHASPADLIPLAVAPLIPKIVLFIPTMLWLAALGSLTMGVRLCYQAIRDRPTTLRRTVVIQLLGYAFLTGLGLWGVSLTDNIYLSNDRWGTPVDSASFAEDFLSIASGVVLPALILLALVSVLFRLWRERPNAASGESWLIPSICAAVFMYGAGRVEGVERKHAEFGAILVGPSMSPMRLPFLSFHYGYGSCLSYESASTLLGETAFKVLMKGEPPLAPMVRYIGQLSGTEFFFLPNQGELIVAKKGSVASRSIVSCGAMDRWAIMRSKGTDDRAE